MPGVSVVSIPVSDQDRAAAFYAEHLGFRVVIDVEDPDACRATLVAAGTECSDVEDQDWGRCFTCEDPDGNGLVVARITRRSPG
jgi:uncharacterized glyoxalase superfamily protein PhnB